MVGRNLDEVLESEAEERTTYMSPWLRSHSINVIVAPSGLGKTFIALLLAHSIASGSDFLRYPNLQPARVLFVDGEMGYAPLGERLNWITNASEYPANPDHLRVISYEDFEDGIPNLSNPELFSNWEGEFNKHDVIIIDNLDTCTAPIGGRDNDLDMWLRMRPWLLKLKQSGKCIILIHHTNKAGEIYGTSKIKNTLDFGIALSNPGLRTSADNAFKLSFFKTRGVNAKKLYPLWVELNNGVDTLHVTSNAYADFLKDKVIEVSDMANGYKLSVQDQADYLGITKKEFLNIKHSAGGDDFAGEMF